MSATPNSNSKLERRRRDDETTVHYTNARWISIYIAAAERPNEVRAPRINKKNLSDHLSLPSFRVGVGVSLGFPFPPLLPCFGSDLANAVMGVC